MHQVCICTLGADFLADFTNTLGCTLKSVQIVCKCTPHADLMCRLCADLKWFSVKSAHRVCICTLCAELWYILCRLYAYYLVFFKLVLVGHCFWAMSMSYILTSTFSVDKNIRQRLGQKMHAHFIRTFFGCMHTMCRIFLGPCTLFLDIENTTFFAVLYRLLPNSY